jgi:hypothetical protein
MKRLLAVLDNIVIPGILVLTWVILYLTSNVRGIAAAVVAGAFLMVVFLYVTYRELRTHAGASRMAANGEADDLLELADRQIARRWTERGRLPFHIYRSIALEAKGDLVGARRALEPAAAARGSWAVLRAAQRVGLAPHPAEARAIYEEELVPAVRAAPGAGSEILAAEAHAKVLLGEGRFEEARPIFEKLAKDVRVGATVRARCRENIEACLTRQRANT